MLNGKRLRYGATAVAAVFALAGTSAFADSRPSNETRTARTEQRIRERGVRAEGRVEVRGSAPRESTRERGTQGETRERDAARSSRDQIARDRISRDRSGSDRAEGAATTREASGSRGGDQWRGSEQNRDRNRGTREGDRNDRDRNRGTYEQGHSRSNETYRNRSGSSRNGGSYDRGGARNDHYRGGSRQPYHHRGRITKYHRYNDGYRVWIAGAPYPFFVPDWYYRRSPFRIGVVIDLGGYYNPGGYYDYYDGAYAGSSYSNGILRGVVESVDYRRDTFVIRNEATGSFVTVAMRGYGRWDNEVRPGDYVEISGDWRRNGLFEARRVDLLDDGYRRY